MCKQVLILSYYQSFYTPERFPSCLTNEREFAYLFVNFLTRGSFNGLIKMCHSHLYTYLFAIPFPSDGINSLRLQFLRHALNFQLFLMIQRLNSIRCCPICIRVIYKLCASHYTELEIFKAFNETLEILESLNVYTRLKIIMCLMRCCSRFLTYSSYPTCSPSLHRPHG